MAAATALAISAVATIMAADVKALSGSSCFSAAAVATTMVAANLNLFGISHEIGSLRSLFSFHKPYPLHIKWYDR